MSNNYITLTLLTLYVLAIIIVGIFNRKNESSEAYFLASRKLPAWLLAITFIASWWGGGSAIDMVDHAYVNGMSSFWVYGVPVLLSTFLMLIFAKGIRNITTISQPQLLAERYDNRVALLQTIFIIIFMVISTAVQIIVVARFFQSFFNISYEVGAIIGLSIVLLYSFFGGFKGVVLTDLLQFFFFLFTAIFLFYIAYDKSGGITAVNNLASEQGKIGYTSFFNDVSSNFAFVITFGTAWMIQANVWQRISAAKTARSAQKMMVFSFIAFIPLYLMVTYIGMYSSVFYSAIPKGGIVPDMVKQLKNPILSSIIFVGLCSAIMSTMDSLLNTGALSLTVDIYKKHIAPQSSPAKQVSVARLSTIIVGLLSLFIALKIDSVLTISWIGSDFLTTGAFIPLILGFIWVRGTAPAAVASMLFGLMFSSYNLAVALGFNLPIAWKIASIKQVAIGMTASLVIYIVVSLLTKGDVKKSKAFITKAKLLG